MNQTITPKRAAQIHAKLLAKAQAKLKENMTAPIHTYTTHYGEIILLTEPSDQHPNALDWRGKPSTFEAVNAMVQACWDAEEDVPSAIIVDSLPLVAAPRPVPASTFEIAARQAELVNAVAKAIEPFLGRTEAHRAEEVAEAVLRVIRGDRS